MQSSNQHLDHMHLQDLTEKSCYPTQIHLSYLNQHPIQGKVYHYTLLLSQIIRIIIKSLRELYSYYQTSIEILLQDHKIEILLK